MDYVFTPAIGVNSVRLNLQMAQVIPKGDVSTMELVPVKFQDALVRVEASTLEVGHVVAQLDSNAADPVTGPLINIVFQVVQVVVQTALVGGFSLLRRIQDHDFFPIDLKYESKVDDHVMLFTAVGINDLQNGPCHALFGLLPGYKPFSVTAKVSAGPAAGVGGGDSAVMKPTSAALQDELMQAAGLKKFSNVQYVSVGKSYPW